MLTQSSSVAAIPFSRIADLTHVFITGAKVCSGIPNQSAAVADALLARGVSVFVHCLTEETGRYFDRREGVKEVFQSPVIDLRTLEQLGAALQNTDIASIRVGVLIYESFTGYLPSERQTPFLPMEEENFELPYVGQMISNRLVLIQQMKSLLRRLASLECLNPTVVFVSSLAAHRAAGQLSLDLIHKSLGAALFETAAIELSHQFPHFLPSFVEILPGIVDGIYDGPGVKERLLQRSHGHFDSFAEGYGPENFPSLSAEVVGEIAALYFLSSNPDDFLPEEYRKFLLAGRTSLEALKAELLESLHLSHDKVELKYGSLPQYALVKGVSFGRLPALKPQQIIRVPITPPGQLF